jgi:hypothetical protein
MSLLEEPFIADAAFQMLASSADSRPPEEFELGLLLVGLSDGGFEPAESLLLQIASSPDTASSWSIALAKRLRQLRPLLNG